MGYENYTQFQADTQLVNRLIASAAARRITAEAMFFEQAAGAVYALVVISRYNYEWYGVPFCGYYPERFRIVRVENLGDKIKVVYEEPSEPTRGRKLLGGISTVLVERSVSFEPDAPILVTTDLPGHA